MKTFLPYGLLLLSLLVNFSLITVLVSYRRRNLSLLCKSRTDELTGLLNRFTCIDEINLQQQCFKDWSKSDPNRNKALFLIDLDNFKHINDNYGHRTGDDVLKLLSDCMQKLFPENAVMGRWGGDEFLIFLDRAGTPDQIEKKANKLCRRLEQTMKELEHPLLVSISIGIALATPGEDFSSLMQKADNALYYVKKHGKNSYHIYEV